MFIANIQLFIETKKRSNKFDLFLLTIIFQNYFHQSLRVGSPTYVLNDGYFVSIDSLSSQYVKT